MPVASTILDESPLTLCVRYLTVSFPMHIVCRIMQPILNSSQHAATFQWLRYHRLTDCPSLY